MTPERIRKRFSISATFLSKRRTKPITELSFSLHPAQLQIFNSPSRFKIVAAGRRFGKSYLSAVTLLIEALRDKNEFGYDLQSKVVYYVAPTFNQAKDIMWKVLKQLGRGVITDTLENTGVIKLINGREIHLKGSDRPETLRGVGLSYVVLDEYATMKPEVWEEIIRPTLSDVKGGALFIGTPAGKNHFYKLFVESSKDTTGTWRTFEFKSIDNPFLDSKEVESAKQDMTTQAFRQEYEASFSYGGAGLFKEEWVIRDCLEPPDGDYYITLDPAGYSDDTSKSSTLDEAAIAIVKVGPWGWWVKDIDHGRWDTRETAVRFLRHCQKNRPLAAGIEKGALKNAIMPYISDTMRRIGTYPNLVELTHGGKNKASRIMWALQGRMEHKRVKFNDAPYLERLIGQMMDFPNPLAHDDLLDALAYIDQIATTIYGSYDDEQEDWKPLDTDAGF